MGHLLRAPARFIALGGEHARHSRGMRRGGLLQDLHGGDQQAHPLLGLVEEGCDLAEVGQRDPDSTPVVEL